MSTCLFKAWAGSTDALRCCRPLSASELRFCRSVGSSDRLRFKFFNWSLNCSRILSLALVSCFNKLISSLYKTNLFWYELSNSVTSRSSLRSLFACCCGTCSLEIFNVLFWLVTWDFRMDWTHANCSCIMYSLYMNSLSLSMSNNGCESSARFRDLIFFFNFVNQKRSKKSESSESDYLLLDVVLELVNLVFEIPV